MKIVCSKANLIEGINTVQKAVSSKTTLPILEGILMEAKEKMKLTGNDLEIGIECYVEADIQREGAVVLNSKILGDIVRRLPDSEVLIEVKENNLVIIESENSHFEIKGLNSSGFPELPSIEKENAFKIQQKVLKEMIKQTLFAVSVDENRPIFTGSLFEYKENELTIVSIDGFRMALRKFKIESDARDISVVIPGKTLNEINKILQPVEDEIMIYNSNNQIMFDMGNSKVVSRLLEGKFLNYKSLTPAEFETKIHLNTKEMLSSIERASLVNIEEKKYPVKFNIGDEKLVITSNTEIGASREELRVDMHGSKMEIGFNPRYFIEALRVIEDDEIDICIASSVGPCTIRPTSGEAFTYMIAVVRT